MSGYFSFSPMVVVELQLDHPDMLHTIAADAASEREAARPAHVVFARVLRLMIRPTSAQRAIEADADALAMDYGLWHGQRIAAVCGTLEVPQCDRTPDTWRRIAHELSWRMGCASSRIPDDPES